MKKPAAPTRSRGRPRSFDRDAALAAAMEVFWRRGYDGASMQSDLDRVLPNPDVGHINRDEILELHPRGDL